MVCDWCGEVWAEGNWLQRGAGIEGVIHGGREGKERKRCAEPERGDVGGKEAEVAAW